MQLFSDPIAYLFTMPTPLRAMIGPTILTLCVICSLVRAQNVTPTLDRIDAIVDRSLVLPVDVEDTGTLDSELDVRLDDGRSIDARLVRVIAVPTLDPGAWTPPSAIWSAISPRRADLSIPGRWIAIIDLPIDAVGQGIWIESERYEPNWLPAPQRVILETRGRADDGFWDPALSETEQSSPLVEHALSAMRADPFARWRVELMTTGFSPERDGSSRADTQRELDAIFASIESADAHTVLDEIADHTKARWQIILGRLWLIDPGVARAMKHQLTRTAHIGSARVPMWDDDSAELSALAHDLLSPFVNDDLRVERARGWLESRRHAVCWVVDDAGFAQRDPALLAPTIAFVALDESRGASLARFDSDSIRESVQSAQEGTLSTHTLLAPSTREYEYESITSPRRIDVRVASESFTLLTQGTIPIASPPGIIVGPLLRDWTLSALRDARSAQGALPIAGHRTTGLLTRDGSPTEPGTWRLAIETDRPTPDSDISIRVWVGPFSAPRAVWTFTSNLGLTESRMDPDIEDEPSVRDALTPSRWNIEIELPEGIVRDNELLLIGIERESDGIRSAWPRRMMPWDTEPGRFAIDVNGWLGRAD